MYNTYICPFVVAFQNGFMYVLFIALQTGFHILSLRFQAVECSFVAFQNGQRGKGRVFVDGDRREFVIFFYGVCLYYAVIPVAPERHFVAPQFSYSSITKDCHIIAL